MKITKSDVDAYVETQAMLNYIAIEYLNQAGIFYTYISDVCIVKNIHDEYMLEFEAHEAICGKQYIDTHSICINEIIDNDNWKEVIQKIVDDKRKREQAERDAQQEAYVKSEVARELAEYHRLHKKYGNS